MIFEFIVELAWKSTFAGGSTLLILWTIKSRSAAEKSLVASLGLACVLFLPVGTVLLPEVEVSPPAAASQVLSASLSALVSEAPAPANPEVAVATTSYPWRTVVVCAYSTATITLLLRMLIAFVRLQLLRARSSVLTDSRWITALASAREQLGIGRETALLRSDELDSPISWGIFRPVIIVDTNLVQEPDRAGAIIAHELAHITRLDWLGVLFARFATSICWFNPLVWLLARKTQQLCEEAADDAVLRSDIPSTDYAEILVRVARRAHQPISSLANGVLPTSGLFGERVTALLDQNRRRVPASLRWTTACASVGITATIALGAVNPLSGSPGPNIPTRGLFGEAAAAKLAAIPHPQAQALARAMQLEDWNARRRQGGSTRFHEMAAVDPLLLALRDSRPTIRRIAVWGLSELRPPEAVEPLIGLLNDEDARVRGGAARALGDLGVRKHAPRISKLLGDASPWVRVETAHALGDLQNPAVRAALASAAVDPDPAVRQKVSWALRQIDEAESILRR